eukprot:g1718.t1
MHEAAESVIRKHSRREEYIELEKRPQDLKPSDTAGFESIVENIANTGALGLKQAQPLESWQWEFMGHSLLRLHESSGDFELLDDALVCYREATASEKEPSPEELFRAAQVYRRQGAHQGALQLCAMIISKPTAEHLLPAVLTLSLACMWNAKGGLDERSNEYLMYLLQNSTRLGGDSTVDEEKEEERILFLAARALEKRRLREQADAGYSHIFLKLHKKENEDWQLWIRDPSIWLEQAAVHMARQDWEFADDMLTEALMCSSLQQDSFWADRALVAERLGDHARSKKFIKNIAKGEFWSDFVLSYRRVPFPGRVRTAFKDFEAVAQRCPTIVQLARDTAARADLGERERLARRRMWREEMYMREYYTELMIWNSCIDIERVARGFLARKFRRLFVRRATILQSLWRRRKVMWGIYARLCAVKKMKTVSTFSLGAYRIQRNMALFRTRTVVHTFFTAHRFSTAIAVEKVKRVTFLHATAARMGHAIARAKLGSVWAMIYSAHRLLRGVELEKKRREGEQMKRAVRLIQRRVRRFLLQKLHRAICRLNSSVVLSDQRWYAAVVLQKTFRAWMMYPRLRRLLKLPAMKRRIWRQQQRRAAAVRYWKRLRLRKLQQKIHNELLRNAHPPVELISQNDDNDDADIVLEDEVHEEEDRDKDQHMETEKEKIKRHTRKKKKKKKKAKTKMKMQKKAQRIKKKKRKAIQEGRDEEEGAEKEEMVVVVVEKKEETVEKKQEKVKKTLKRAQTHGPASTAIMRLYYKGGLSTITKTLVERRLRNIAVKIQAAVRRRNAYRKAALLRREKRRREKAERERAEKLARRKRALELRERRRKEEYEAKLRKERKAIMRGLVGCFQDPSWDVLEPLLLKGSVALGEDHDLMKRGRRVAAVLEKEWIHFHGGAEQSRIKLRARNRKFESVEEDLDEAFVSGNLPIAPSSAKVVALGDRADERHDDEARDVQQHLHSPIRSFKAKKKNKAKKKSKAKTKTKKRKEVII